MERRRRQSVMTISSMTKSAAERSTGTVGIALYCTGTPFMVDRAASTRNDFLKAIGMYPGLRATRAAKPESWMADRSDQHHSSPRFPVGHRRVKGGVDDGEI